MWSTPLPKLAISRSCSPAWVSTAASIAIGHRRHQDLGGLHRLDQLGAVHRLVVFVETGVEQFAHPRLDMVGQFARDDDERLATIGHSCAPSGAIRTQGSACSEIARHPHDLSAADRSRHTGTKCRPQTAAGGVRSRRMTPVQPSLTLIADTAAIATGAGAGVNSLIIRDPGDSGPSLSDGRIKTKRS